MAREISQNYLTGVPGIEKILCQGVRLKNWQDLGLKTKNCGLKIGGILGISTY